MVGLIMPTTPRQEENAMSKTFRNESRNDARRLGRGLNFRRTRS
jgi:hypothetical protein